MPSPPAPASRDTAHPHALLWHIERVDAPKWFEKMTDRSLALDASGHPHIAYGADHLYYAWHDGTSWHLETVDSSCGVGRYAALALDGPVALVCAGEGGGRRLALEDVIGAGAIVDAALSLEPRLMLDDGAQMAHWAFLACRDDLAGALANTQHGLYLLSLGLGEDVRFCARLDVWDVVPRMEALAPNIAVLRP